MKLKNCVSLFLLSMLVSTLAVASADKNAMEDESMEDDQEVKFYQIDADGTVDWATYNGFRRFHATCLRCHGVAGTGSSFAPSLIDAVKKIGYEGYVDAVVNGRSNFSASSQSAMPSFATNKNVMCFINDIYAYLSARADGLIDTRRPKHGPKTQEAKDNEKSCLGRE